ncbi:DUF5925 domain-containing protein [Streptomyces bambusae]|uniref:DUF5925 domain-containing protein n=1 Tax=Streptomyces bambusae TaxID=1550616 RepID=UPI001CFC95CB|nr:DUF5925 domain-containing protein [Streptomyces bambusae]MCB5164619.1 DUF5925 domain-containing protein [Streptomyces bambusae]
MSTEALSALRDTATRPGPTTGDGRNPAQLTLRGTENARHAIQAMALAPFLDGTQPYARTGRLHGLDGAPRWEVCAGRLVRQFTSEAVTVGLLEGPGWTATVARMTKGSSTHAEIAVTAGTEALAAEVLEGLTRAHEGKEPADHATVPIGFWHLSELGTAVRISRDTKAPRWDAIRQNYTAAARDRLDHLAALGPDGMDGAILLVHGPPGTGKTTALRALAQEWRDWCEFEYVLDPENLFSSSGYLLDTALNRGPEHSPWRALVLEDCDELLRSDAKRAAGQSMARLLNLSDGLLGQDSGTLLVMTTNEDVHRLHPAVTRPGRCMAQIEVGPLTPEEAARWRGGVTARGPGGPATLAELYARTREESGRPSLRHGTATAPVGMYM